MWKAIAAGLMCLGFVTLGIAASRAQEDVIVIEGQPEGEPVPATPAEGADRLKDQARETTVEVEIGGVGRGVRMPIAATGAFAVFDPGTREALEKLIAELKAEVKRLDGEGKREDSAQKMQSIQALEQILNPRVRRAIVGDENTRAGQELKKLHARLTELRNQTAINQDADAHAKIQEEIAGLHKKLAEAWQASGAVAGHPGGAGSANTVNLYSPPGAGVPANIWGQGRVASSDPPEAAVLSRKAMALQQAAAQLQQAGLGEQAAELRKQAEMLEAQAEKMRVSLRKVFASANPGPVTDLQRSIRELQEQIQLLRKEVAELREQLQKARQ